MQFSGIPGFNDIKQTLINSVRNNHIAHAQLFAGKEGCPNLALALAYATYLNCHNKQENDSCGTCPSCHKFGKFIHPDLHFVFPVGSTKNLTGKEVVSSNFLKEWRNFLGSNIFGNISDWSQVFGGENKQLNISKEESRNIIKNLMLTTYEGGFKVMIMWLPEYMHQNCANAILKILEEPPKKTILLLVSNDLESLLNTILSRAQLFRIRMFNDDELQEILTNKYNVHPSQVSKIILLAEGNLNEALKLLDEVDDDSHKMFRDWMRYCYSRDYTQMVQWSEKFQKLNKISQKSLLQYGLNMMRESLVLQYDAAGIAKAAGEELEFTKNFSKALSPDKIEMISELFNKSFYYLERNANAKILFLDLSLKIARFLRS
ncbi:MAG: DNA polymerase III subunit delta [Bacteroidota bacterium]|nr:DNA polymerase III subunit delta [Bacteroidota bacterium]